MKQNKIVITDWGGVIENHSEEQYVFHNSLKHVLDQFSSTPIPSNYQELMRVALAENGVTVEDMGVSTTEHAKVFLDKLFDLFHIEKYAGMYSDFYDTYTQLTSDTPYDRELVRYIVGLKDRCQIGILSNLSVLDSGRQNRQLGWNNFDYKWLSYEMGVMKPNLEAYRRVEQDCGLKGSQILFIEDVEKNLAIPREQFGWRTYAATYMNTKSTIDAIERFLKE